jgi:hypothetical protein
MDRTPRRCREARCCLTSTELAGVVGARGFEPLTSSVSRKRSPPELSALFPPMVPGKIEAGTGIEPVYEALQASA